METFKSACLSQINPARQQKVAYLQYRLQSKHWITLDSFGKKKVPKKVKENIWF